MLVLDGLDGYLVRTLAIGVVGIFTTGIEHIVDILGKVALEIELGFGLLGGDGRGDRLGIDACRLLDKHIVARHPIELAVAFHFGAGKRRGCAKSYQILGVNRGGLLCGFCHLRSHQRLICTR